jgi:glutamyl-tRNA synthetase
MEFAAMGYPAAAMRNYLARLGWSHGDDELFTDAQALEWFDLSGIGKAPARLDFKKLQNVAAWHIAQMEDERLVAEVETWLAIDGRPPLSQSQKEGLKTAMYCLKDRARSLPDLMEKAQFILADRPIEVDEKAAGSLDAVSRGILSELTAQLQNDSWTRDNLEERLTAAAESHGLKFGKLASPLRAALAGRTVTPSVYDMMLVLGRSETIARLKDAAAPRD